MRTSVHRRIFQSWNSSIEDRVREEFVPEYPNEGSYFFDADWRGFRFRRKMADSWSNQTVRDLREAGLDVSVDDVKLLDRSIDLMMAGYGTQKRRTDTEGRRNRYSFEHPLGVAQIAINAYKYLAENPDQARIQLGLSNIKIKVPYMDLQFRTQGARIANSYAASVRDFKQEFEKDPIGFLCSLILHDYIEDAHDGMHSRSSFVSKQIQGAGCDRNRANRIMRDVKNVSQKPEEDRDEYIQRVKSKGYRAILQKSFDILHNFYSLRRLRRVRSFQTDKFLTDYHDIIKRIPFANELFGQTAYLPKIRDNQLGEDFTEKLSRKPHGYRYWNPNLQRSRLTVF